MRWPSTSPAGVRTICPPPRGGYLRNGNFRRSCFSRAAREVGLPALVPHELGHPAVSLAIRSGAKHQDRPDDDEARASATMTWDLYGHLYDDDLDRMVGTS